MHPLRQLAGQTAIYGLATIVPRLLNYLLVPFYTRLLLQNEYGIITELYAYIAFFFVLLLYGMETAYFRFAEKEPDQNKVFSTTLISVFSTSIAFVAIITVFLQPIAGMLQYHDHEVYILLAALIVAIDSFTAIQFAQLRKLNKAFKFSFIKVTIVSINIVLNLYFIWFCDYISRTDPNSPFLFFYTPGRNVEYVLISNLVASLSGILILLPNLFRIKFHFEWQLLKNMLVYAFPLLIVGITGMINEVSDKVIFKYLVTVPEDIENPENYILAELGIYGANFKIAVLMTIFIQMFRYAAEPFFFSQAKESNARLVYAAVMKYFILFGLVIFLGINLFLDLVKYFIGPEYWEGLFIVPIILLANLLLGIFYNQSIWYKLNDMTRYGAYIAIIGSMITIALNILLVPRFSYLGSAWGHFACYLAMVIISWFLGQKHYPIQYDMKSIVFYFASAMLLFFGFYFFASDQLMVRLITASALFMIFIGIVVFREKSIRAKFR